MSQNIYRGFADVDRAPAPETLIAFLEAANRLPAIQTYKRRLRELLQLEAGQTALDVGCGAGLEACRIAQDNPDVSVIGLDRESMIDLASDRAESLGLAVRWVIGRAEEIPLPSGTVDACYTERVLKYVPDPATAIAEMVRVLKPGGRIACFELDYAATVLGGDPAVAGAVGDVLNASVSEARMGRRLPGLLHAAGLWSVTYEMVAFSPSPEVHEATVSNPVREALRQNLLPDAASRWLEEQTTTAANGLFTVAFVGVLTSARLPVN
jgi:SAM-dependent methyltransferase